MERRDIQGISDPVFFARVTEAATGFSGSAV